VSRGYNKSRHGLMVKKIKRVLWVGIYGKPIVVADNAFNIDSLFSSKLVSQQTPTPTQKQCRV